MIYHGGSSIQQPYDLRILFSIDTFRNCKLEKLSVPVHGLYAWVDFLLNCSGRQPVALSLLFGIRKNYQSTGWIVYLLGAPRSTSSTAESFHRLLFCFSLWYMQYAASMQHGLSVQVDTEIHPIQDHEQRHGGIVIRFIQATHTNFSCRIYVRVNKHLLII